MTEKKITFETEIKCPHCKKFLIVKNEKTILSEAVKAEAKDMLLLNSK